MRTVLVTIILMWAAILHAGDFDLKTLEGKTIHINNYEGNFLFEDKNYEKQPLLFFFFGTRCPFCEKEIPQVVDMVRAGKLKVIGIQAQMPVTDHELAEFVKSRDIKFDVLKAKEGNRLVRYLMNRGMWAGGVPYYIWIDKYGNLEPIDLDTLLEKIGD